MDYFEIGKIVSKSIMSPYKYGPWNFCDEADIRRIAGNNDTNLRIEVIADAGRTIEEDILHK
mgnify:CR=1 FL=1